MHLDSSAKLTVAITSTARADLLGLTLRTFHSRLFVNYGAVRVIANIDPLYACSSRDEEECLRLLRLYDSRGTPLLFRPARPNFNRAVHRVWTTAIALTEPSGYFLHLEDDWALCQSVNVADVERTLNQDDVASVRLLLRPYRSHAHLQGFSLNPSFINARAAQTALARWRGQEDPEKMVNSLQLGKTLIYKPSLSMVPCVVDLGTYWRKKRGIAKRHKMTKLGFQTVWIQRKDEGLLNRLLYGVRHQIRWSSLLIWQGLAEVLGRTKRRPID